MRDSKSPERATLAVPHSSWMAFVKAAGSGRFPR
ncbi:DUF397 domain-containing protein [Streptomyces roseirectus]|uniref:DUF397 domain-containing protein n=1 Tax=Streptomyces roseirectus TaxID=2768066 RepID=A0A7H0ITP3_9ACTN|nr:DUF397 domain-containing protein [Streptomyces roseirectus]